MITLKAARVNAGLTQKEVSERTGFVQVTISKWERYQTFPKVTQLKVLCKLYGVHMDDIFFPDVQTLSL